MSGTNYIVNCQTCGNVGMLEIYTEGWNNVKIDDSQAQCWDCAKKANPQDWFDLQCVKCATWFNAQDWFDHQGGKQQGQGGIQISDTQWLCHACVKAAVLA